jgi:hypothetical protein
MVLYIPGPIVPGWQFDQILPKLAERAVQYIGERAADKKPFFLYFALTSPPEPITATREIRRSHFQPNGQRSRRVMRRPLMSGRFLTKRRSKAATRLQRPARISEGSAKACESADTDSKYEVSAKTLHIFFCSVLYNV